MNFYSAVFTLVLVLDPIGNIPVFMALLKKLPPKRRLWVIARESLIAFAILVAFLFGGKYMLTSLGLTHAALELAGGIILFLIALRMIFPSKRSEPESNEEPLVVPMAIPLIAGPSALATVLLFANQYPDYLMWVFFTVLTASVISTIILLLAEPLRRILGRRGLTAMERLMGMILTTIAVQMFLTGISSFIKG